MDFNGSVPASRHDSVIITSIPDVRDLALLRVVRIKRQDVDSRYEVENFDLSLVRANDQLTMLGVQFHACDVRVKAIL